MKKIGFDNEKYLVMQSEKIMNRRKQFGGKLYLEFGGKLFDDFHASRVLPGFEPDSKLRMLTQLKDQAEIVFAINAGDIEKILNVRAGGLAIHGGLILSFIVGYILCKYYKERFLDVADLVAPVIAMAQSIGRWGNFFNEEAHGYATDLPWAQIIDGVGYHPTFLYESIWCFLLFIFLMWFSKHKRIFSGQILCLYGILYSIERIFVESFRTDSLMIGPLRQAQVISLVIIAACAILYIYLKKKHAYSNRQSKGEF
jgi:prolipoprotein diacylglyceryl transferase